MSELPAIDSLLPQRGPARLVDAVVEQRDGWVTCAGRLPRQASPARDGWVPSFLALELAAQAAAIVEGLRRFRRDGRACAVSGYLVGLSDVRIARPELHADAQLTARVRYIGGAGSLARYEALVSEGQDPCVSGTLSTFVAAADARSGGP